MVPSNFWAVVALVYNLSCKNFTINRSDGMWACVVDKCYRFGVLHSELYRACEMVIDTAIHAQRYVAAFGWNSTTPTPTPTRTRTSSWGSSPTRPTRAISWSHSWRQLAERQAVILATILARMSARMSCVPVGLVECQLFAANKHRIKI